MSDKRILIMTALAVCQLTSCGDNGHPDDEHPMEGRWTIHGLITGDGAIGWYTRQHQVDSTGNYQCESIYSSYFGDVACETGDDGTYLVDDGLINTDALPYWNAALNRRRDVYVSAKTNVNNLGDLTVSVKRGAGFQLPDLEGDWKLIGITSADGGLSGTLVGALHIDLVGVVTCSSYAHTNGSTGWPCLDSTQVALADDGSLTAAGVDLRGTVSSGKDLIVVVLTGGGAYHLLVMVRASGTFATAEAEGVWRTHALATGDAPLVLGYVQMSHSVDSSGNWTCESYYDTLGLGGRMGCAYSQGLTISLQPDGDLVGHTGFMSPGKDIIFYTYEASNDGGWTMPALAVAVKAP